MQSDIILIAYDSPLGGGDQGAEYTVVDIASRFCGLHLTQSVQALLRCCNTSHHVQHSDRIPYGLLRWEPTPETWASWVNIDFITTLPAAARDGYDWIITIVDPLTNTVYGTLLGAVDLITKAFTRDCNDMWVQNMGIQDDIITDRDMCFSVRFVGILDCATGNQMLSQYRRSSANRRPPEEAKCSCPMAFECIGGSVPNEVGLPTAIAWIHLKHSIPWLWKDRSIWANMGWVPRMPIEMLVLTLGCNHQSKAYMELDKFAEEMMFNFRLSWELLEEAQTTMILEVTMSGSTRDFKVKESDILSTQLLTISYANYTQLQSAYRSFRKFQQSSM